MNFHRYSYLLLALGVLGMKTGAIAQNRHIVATDVKTQQILSIESSVAKRIDVEIAKIRQRDAPSTVKTLNLYKTTMMQVIDRVLKQSVKKPLSAARLSFLKSSIVNAAIGPFIVDVGSTDSLDQLESVENQMSNISRTWDEQGKSLTADLWRTSFLQGLYIALEHPSSPEDQKKSTGQITKLSMMINQKVIRMMPSASSSQIQELADDLVKRALAGQKNLLSPSFKLIFSPKDWNTLDEMLETVTRDPTFIANTTSKDTKDPNALSSAVEYAYMALWSVGESAMTLQPSPHVVYPANFAKNWQTYLNSLNDMSRLSTRRKLSTSIETRQLLEDRLSVANLLAMGTELSQ